MSAKVAFLTGASGYIGRQLTAKLLAEGWIVHVLSRQNDHAGDVVVHFYDGSTESVVKAIEVSRPSVIFHLASLYLTDHKSKDVLPLINSNILLGTQVLEGMTASGVTRIVNVGTSWQRYSESNHSPVNLYAATKQAFEDILAYYADAHQIACITLKLYDTYGPGDWRPKIVNLLISAAKTGEQIKLSPGEQKLHLVHISDVVDGFLNAARKLETGALMGKHQIYELPSLHPCSVLELVEIIEKIKGCSLNVVWGGRAYRQREVMNPVVEEKKLSDWYEEINLNAGIKELLECQSK